MSSQSGVCVFSLVTAHGKKLFLSVFVKPSHKVQLLLCLLDDGDVDGTR